MGTELQLPQSKRKFEMEKFEPKFVKLGPIKISNKVKVLEDEKQFLRRSMCGSVDACRMRFLHLSQSL